MRFQQNRPIARTEARGGSQEQRGAMQFQENRPTTRTKPRGKSHWQSNTVQGICRSDGYRKLGRSHGQKPGSKARGNEAQCGYRNIGRSHGPKPGAKPAITRRNSVPEKSADRMHQCQGPKPRKEKRRWQRRQCNTKQIVRSDVTRGIGG